MSKKIALCLSGHLRDGDKTSYPRLKEIILDKYDCDIFVSSWDINAFGGDNFNFSPTYSEKQSEADIITRIIDTYNPKKYNIESGKPEWLSSLEKKWNNLRLGAGHHPYPHVSPMLAMFRKIENANDLRCEYQQQTGVVYDLVIRFRFDAAPEYDFIEKNKHLWENNKTVCFGPYSNFGFNDILFFGDPDIMTLAARCFSNTPVREDNLRDFRNGEEVLRKFIESNNIPHTLTRDINFYANFRAESMNAHWVP
jgi:hypothetical protein